MDRSTVVFLVFSISLVQSFSIEGEDLPNNFFHQVIKRSPQFGGGWNNQDQFNRDANNAANTAGRAAVTTANVLASPFLLAGAAASSAAHGVSKRSPSPQFGGGWNNQDEFNRDANNAANTAGRAAVTTAHVLASPFLLAGAAASSAAHGVSKRSPSPQFGGGWNNQDEFNRDANNAANTAGRAAVTTAHVLASPFLLAGAAASSAAHGVSKRSPSPQFGGGWNNQDEFNRDANNAANTAGRAAVTTAHVLASPFLLAGAAASSAAHGVSKRSPSPQFGGGWNNQDEFNRDANNAANTAGRAAVTTAHVLASPFLLAGAAASSAARGVSKRSADPQFGGGWNNQDEFNRDANNAANTAGRAAVTTANVLASPFLLAGAAASSAAHGVSKRSPSPQFGGGWNNQDEFNRDANNAANTAGRAAVTTAHVLASPFLLAGAAASSAARGVSKRSADPQFGGGWNNQDEFNRDANNAANTAGRAAVTTANVLASPFLLAGAAASSAAHGVSKRSPSPQFGGGWNNQDQFNRDANNAANTAGRAAVTTAYVLASPFLLAGAAASSAAHGVSKRSPSPQFGGGWNNQDQFNRDANNAANTAGRAAVTTANVLASPFLLAGAAASSAARGVSKRSADPQFGGGWNNQDEFNRDANNAANTAGRAAITTANVLASPFLLAGAAASSAAHGVSKRNPSPQFGGGWNNQDEFNRDANNAANTAGRAAVFSANVLASPFLLAGAAASSAAHGVPRRNANPGLFGGSNNGAANAAGQAVGVVSNILTSPFRLAGAAANAAHGVAANSGHGSGGLLGHHGGHNNGLTNLNGASTSSDSVPLNLGGAATAVHGAGVNSGQGAGGQSVVSSSQYSGQSSNNDFNRDITAHGATGNTGQGYSSVSSNSGQYSGFSSNNQGANSGASEAADLNNHAAGHFVNVASNNAASGAQGASGQSGIYDGHSQQSKTYGGQSSISEGQFSANSGKDYGSQSSANSGIQGIGGNTQKFSKSESFKESHYSFQSSDGGSSFGSQSQGAQSYGRGNEQKQQQFGLENGATKHDVASINGGLQSAGNGQWQHDVASINGGLQSAGNGQWQHDVASINGGLQSAGNGQWQQGASHGVGSLSDGSQFTLGTAPSGLGFQRSGVAPNALGGALNLATLGLISAAQTRCTTCGGDFALSNAKSTDGDAVALSLGL